MAKTRAELIGDLAQRAGVPSLTATDTESILALAAIAAHGTGDRTSAPSSPSSLGSQPRAPTIAQNRSTRSDASPLSSSPTSKSAGDLDLGITPSGGPRSSPLVDARNLLVASKRGLVVAVYDGSQGSDARYASRCARRGSGKHAAYY